MPDDRLIIGISERGGFVHPVISRPSPLAVGPFMHGRRPEEAVAVLGQVFNLCRHAQQAAARLVFGLPAADARPLADEILRDTLFRLFIDMPQRLGLAAQPLPQGWREGSDRTSVAVFGISRDPLESPAAFERWLASGAGLAPLFARLRDRFAPGDGAARPLPLVSGFASGVENSGAARHADAAVMRHIEDGWGRGPLWRATARLFDFLACRDGTLPEARRLGPGEAEAPTARGSYRLRGTVAQGLVSSFERRTPTDDICEPGGTLESALAALPWAKRDLAPLIVAGFDPCLPWQVAEMANA